MGPYSVQSLSLPIQVSAWWARQDSNLQPDRYERSALTVELRARHQGRRTSNNLRGQNAIAAKARIWRPCGVRLYLQQALGVATEDFRLVLIR